MKYCSECGAKIPDEALFCAECGTKVMEQPQQQQQQPAAVLPMQGNERPAGKQPVKQPETQPQRQVPGGKLNRILNFPFQDKFVGLYLFFALFFLSAGGDFFASVKMMKIQAFLTQAQVDAGARTGVILACILMIPAVLSTAGERKNPFIKIGRTVLSFLPVLFAAGVSLRLMSWLTDRTQEAGMGIMILLLGAGAICVFLMTWFLFSAVADNAVLGAYRGLIRNLLNLFCMPHKLIAWFLGMLVLVSIPFGSRLFLFLIPADVTESFSSNMTVWLLQAAAETFVLLGIYRSMRKSALKQEAARQERKMRQTGAAYVGQRMENSKAGVVRVLIYTGISIVLALIGVVCFIPKEAAKEEEAEFEPQFYALDARLLECTSYLFRGDMTDAYLSADKAVAILNGWRYYLEDDTEKLEEHVSEYGSEAIIWMLYLSGTKDVEKLEKYMITKDPYDADLRNILLYYYSQLEKGELSEQEKAYKQEILLECVGAREYVFDMPEPVTSSRDKSKMQDILEERFGAIEGCRDCLQVLQSAGGFGLDKNNTLEKMMNVAEQNPDVEVIQYLTGMLGASATGDSAWHYGKTIAALQRFVELSEKNKQISDEELMTRQLSAADLMVKVKGYREAIELLDRIDPGEDKELKMQIMVQKMNCYDRLGDSDKCYEEAEKLVKADTDDMDVYYYYGLGALKKQDRSKMLDALEKIGEYLEKANAEDENYIDIQTDFHILAQYSTMMDSASWTKYQFAFYSEMSDSEKNKLSPFVHNYLEALDAYYNRREYESAMAAADAVLRSNSDLAYVQYLKGAISYSTQEYENAVTCYQKALDLYGDNATFYYALAYAYDALGDYQAAYIASGKCKDMVPTVNHEEDWYGLGYHNVTFYERVKAEVEK